MKYFQLIVFLVSVTFLSGCASLGTYNPATERRELIFISTPSEVSMGKDIHSQLQREYEISYDLVKTGRLKNIGQRLAQVSDRQDFKYNFYLINKDEMNAFTTPGGNIYFFSGLLDKLTSDDEVASVLAHEIGHCAARHTVKKFQAALGYDLIGSILLSQVSPENQMRNVLLRSSNTVMSLIFSAYGRQDEFESDHLGLKYMHLAGFNLDGMIKAFEVLEQNSKGDGRIPLILRTHPYIKDRIIKVKDEITRYKKAAP
ncbi:MAG: hypothetical protein A2Z88_02670 [Omnitrophica WOR_2 bacterium GWA2_47_8]|nr:MAG: hypothetical protein A2Z88_02670 [Omnitrophica WOR_2 bacterium GWA2_47_8]